ncbi:hypothetical protein [Deinococcus hopiensis]|uniref:DUF4386 domain-containing protein n=1 Tax=Deinococcus hopiensis KR-140 TaxID=695939 RepID=A0A1W1UTD6_9DEIO|nr:hypothetical protein [Deinococcus hopiensis]SMB84395.1 hypothetical protein SAMN00790413_05111 [Deinococcus hopiensis KR-140]
MTFTKEGLIQNGGLAAAACGLLFILVQMLHPAEVLTAVTTLRWAVVHGLTLLMAILGLLGVTSVYMHQAERTGWSGFLGFLLLFTWLILVAAFTFVETFILPLLVAQDPHFVGAFLGIFGGQPGGMKLGPLAAVGPLSGVLYMLGAGLLGITTLRAALLPRRAGALLVIAALSPLAVSFLPHPVQRIAAVPMGVSLIWLGLALWRGRQQLDTTPLNRQSAAL